MLIDIHCHLTGTEYGNIEDVLDRAKENGVDGALLKVGYAENEEEFVSAAPKYQGRVQIRRS